MKRHICAALAAALLAPGLCALAQDDAPPPEHSEQTRKDDGMAARMKRLGLDDEQSAKFQDAVKAHREAMKRRQQALKDGVRKLAEDLKSKAPDDELLAALAALKTARRAMIEENEKFEQGLAAFLTPAQQAKMALGAARMMTQGREGPREMREGAERGGDGGEHRGPPDAGGDQGPQGGGQ